MRNSIHKRTNSIYDNEYLNNEILDESISKHLLSKTKQGNFLSNKQHEGFLPLRNRRAIRNSRDLTTHLSKTEWKQLPFNQLHFDSSYYLEKRSSNV